MIGYAPGSPLSGRRRHREDEGAVKKGLLWGGRRMEELTFNWSLAALSDVRSGDITLVLTALFWR